MAASSLKAVARLGELSHSALLQVAVAGLKTEEACRIAECFLGLRILPDWARDGVLMAPDLLTRVLGCLQSPLIVGSTVPGVCVKWSTVCSRMRTQLKMLAPKPAINNLDLAEAFKLPAKDMTFLLEVMLPSSTNNARGF